MRQRTVPHGGSVVVVLEGGVIEVVVTPEGSETTTNSLKDVTRTVMAFSVKSQHPAIAQPLASISAHVGHSPVLALLGEVD